MIRLSTLKPKLERAWRWLRAPFWLGLGTAIGFGIPYAIYLDHLVREEFATLTFAQPSRVYARPLALAVGDRLSEDALLKELEASRYRPTPDAIQPGTYVRDGAKFTVSARAFQGAHGAEPARRFVATIRQGRVASLADAAGTKLDTAWLDPARIATLYGPKQQERRIVRLQDVPPLLLSTLQAVEDRDFKHHIGINPMAIVRAAWVNLRSGEVVQGGSTLTQQLVRNLFLSRQQTLWRKVNEAGLALMIEARYSKTRILEAYVNEVYLGQQGAQAVHGFAAASEFHFGRELNALSASEIALLVGLVQGPSLYDPRRAPERAKERRDLVLRVMEETGLINKHDRALATKSPLAVSSRNALPRNRYPAFVELVRAQIRSDFPDASLSSDGLAIITTLSPSAQAFAEAAVAERLKAMGKNAAKLEAAVVVTNARTGEVEALVGGRDSDGSQGFNRALNAARPIGSLVKPFVYLVALAQPRSWSLASVLEDRAIGLRLQNGQVWQPANVDQIEHGNVMLIDALARSYNLATVRLGLELDVRKVARVLEALIPGAQVPPVPALLLGAVELSPYQVAQAYQYLASDGRPQPLTSVAAVLDSRGRPLTRYEHPLAQGELVVASRLVGFALQEAGRSGTAKALGGLGLGHLAVAGKTGTSNDQRDSWFAGYTGSHLAVVWMGADDNTQTGLYGSTGSMRVWASLFAKLPSAPLKLEVGDNPLLAYVEPEQGRAVDAHCEGARAMPFVRGYEPIGVENCGDWRFSEWLGGPDEEGDSRYGRYENQDEQAYEEAMREREMQRIEEEREAASEKPKRRRFRDWFRRDDDDDEDED